MPKKILYIILGGLVIYFSCASQPSTGDGGGATSSTTSSTGIVINTSDGAETLETLPELKLKLKDLPDSLSDNNLKLKSPRLIKAIGDVSTLDPATLPDVKSSAWYEMVRILQNESMAQQMLTSLKEMAQSYSFSVGQTTDLGEGMKVYCTTNGKGGIAYYFTINNSQQEGVSNLMKMYIDVYPTNGKAAVEFITIMNYFDGEVNSSYRMYSYYNEATGEMIDSMDYMGYAFLWKVWWDSPDSVAIITYYGDGFYYNNLTIGWGDNNYGGVINKFSYEDSFSSNKYIYREYYNENGGLVYQGYGNSDSGGVDLSWYEENGINIASYFSSSKPQNITVVYDYWDETVDPYNYGYRTYISNAGGLVLLSNDYVYYFYIKSGLNWASGDCSYFRDSYIGEEKYTNGTTNVQREYYSYTKGLEIPTGQTYFGDTYYFFHYWPLKYLTLDDAYSNYQITRKIVEEYSYTNEWEWEGTTYQNIYNWTYYDWWLDKNRDQVYTNTVDIDINGVLQENDVYLWDDNFGNLVEQKSIFAYGTTDNPLYFKFTGGNIITSVKDKIEGLYTNVSGQNIIDFITNRPIPHEEYFPEL